MQPARRSIPDSVMLMPLQPIGGGDPQPASAPVANEGPIPKKAASSVNTLREWNSTLACYYCDNCHFQGVTVAEVACPNCGATFLSQKDLIAAESGRKFSAEEFAANLEDTRVGRSLRDYPLGWGLIATTVVIAVVGLGMVTKVNHDRHRTIALAIQQREAAQTQAAIDEFARQNRIFDAKEEEKRREEQANANVAAQSAQDTQYDREAIAAFLASGGDSGAFYGAKSQLVSMGIIGSDAAAYLYWVATNGKALIQEKLYVSVMAVYRCGRNLRAAQSIIETLDRYNDQYLGMGVYTIALDAAKGRPFARDVATFRGTLWGMTNSNTPNNDNGKDFESAIIQLAPQ